MIKKKKKNKKNKNKSSNLIGWLFVIALLFGMGYWGYSYLKSPVYHANKAIPNDAIIVIETHNPKNFWDALNYDNVLWKGLQQKPIINHLNRDIRKLDSLLMMDDDFWDLAEDNTFYWSSHLEKDSVSSLWIIGLENAHQENNVNRFVKDYFSDQVAITKKSFLDVNVYCVNNHNKKFYYASAYGIFIASESLALLEKSLRQLKDETGLIEQKDFVEIKETCGKKVDANFYISNKQLNFISKKFSNNAPFSLLHNIENFSFWNGLDLYIKSDSWSWNGYTSISDADLLVLFQAQQPVENKGIYLLPKETTAWIQLGFSEPEYFFDNLSKYQSKSKVLNAVNQKYNVSLIDDFKSFSGNEIYFAWINNAPVLLMHLSDIEIAASTMMKLSDDKHDYQSGEVVRLHSSEFCNAIFGENIFKIRPTHWSIFGEYLVMAESSNMIGSIVDAQHNATESKQYQSMTENIVDRSNFSFCCNFSNCDGFMRRNCSKKLFQQYQKNKSLLLDFNGFYIQFSASSGLFYTNAIISYDSETDITVIHDEREDASSSTIDSVNMDESTSSEDIFDVVSNALFAPEKSEQENTPSKSSTTPEGQQTTKLKGKMILIPYPIYDHSAKDKKFVVFDNQSNMYLIDKNGTIIWTKILHDKPISDVYQVDYYTNGKIQYLFNSKNYLYMIDLKGNWVTGYPKKLNDGAQNPIAVFDYSQKKDYRIVYVDNKGVINNISKEGKPVNGWESPSLSYKISTAAESFSIGKTRYLIFQMDNGKVLMTKQDGSIWMKIEKAFTNTIRSDFYINRTNSKGVLLTTDQKGTLVYIPEKGEVKTTSFGSFSDKHYFIYEDFNGDGSNDFIYLDGKKLTVFDRLQNVILTYVFPSEPTNQPEVFTINKQCYLSIFVASEQKVYIFNKKGLQTAITGTTPANLIKDSKNGKIIVAVGNNAAINMLEL